MQMVIIIVHNKKTKIQLELYLEYYTGDWYLLRGKFTNGDGAVGVGLSLSLCLSVCLSVCLAKKVLISLDLLFVCLSLSVSSLSVCHSC